MHPVGLYVWLLCFLCVIVCLDCLFIHTVITWKETLEHCGKAEILFLRHPSFNLQDPPKKGHMSRLLIAHAHTVTFNTVWVPPHFVFRYVMTYLDTDIWDIWVVCSQVLIVWVRTWEQEQTGNQSQRVINHKPASQAQWETDSYGSSVSLERQM